MKISEELQHHWLWQHKPFAKGQAIIDLVLMSEKENHYIRNKNYNQPIGQLVITESELEKRWGWSRTKIRSFLKQMEDDSLIKIERHPGMTEITIINNPFLQVSIQDKTQEKVQEEKQEKKQLDSAENKHKAEVQEQQKKQVEIQQKNNSDNKEKTSKHPEIIQKTIFDAINGNL